MADGDASNRGATNGAGLTAAMGDPKLMVGDAPFAAGAEIGVGAGSFITDT